VKQQPARSPMSVLRMSGGTGELIGENQLLSRRDVVTVAKAAAAALAASAAARQFSEPQPALAAEPAPTLTYLGDDARALRKLVTLKQAGAKDEVKKGLEITERPLQKLMLAQAPNEKAKAQALNMRGHMSELEFALKNNDFAEYVSKTTGKTYPGGKVERELEEIEETFEEYVKVSVSEDRDLGDTGSGYSYGKPPPLKTSVFEGQFKDPNHPNGYRKISVADGVATILGKDEPTDTEWKIVANLRGREEMLIDFSPKGGPKDLLAKWSKQMDAIEFPDGNKWPKIGGQGSVGQSSL